MVEVQKKLTDKRDDTIDKLAIYVVVWLIAMFLLGSLGIPFALPISLLLACYVYYLREIKQKK
jgi:uncharacterized membrane protein YhdT